MCCLCVYKARQYSTETFSTLYNTLHNSRPSITPMTSLPHEPPKIWNVAIKFKTIYMAATS